MKTAALWESFCRKCGFGAYFLTYYLSYIVTLLTIRDCPLQLNQRCTYIYIHALLQFN